MEKEKTEFEDEAYLIQITNRVDELLRKENKERVRIIFPEGIIECGLVNTPNSLFEGIKVFDANPQKIGKILFNRMKNNECKFVFM